MENYLPIGVCIGFIYFIVMALNLVFSFTNHPFLYGMFDTTTKPNLIYNLMVLLFLSFTVTLLWPFWIVLFFLYIWISNSGKKK